MLSKRIIPCLDVRDGKLTKGIKFKGNVDIGDPVETARMYYEQGADEIVFYDITASSEHRGIMLKVVEEVAKTIFIPFSVGGGISTLEDMRAVIGAGAEKISVNSAAVKNPEIISQGAAAFGSQCVVVGMDVLKVASSSLRFRPPNAEQQPRKQGGQNGQGRGAAIWSFEEGKLERHSVKPGISDGMYTEISGDIEEGMEAVTAIDYGSSSSGGGAAFGIAPRR